MRQDQLNGKRVVVMGLGRFGGGIGVTRWLVRCGAEVLVTDQAAPDELAASVARLSDLPVTFHLGEHDPADLDRCDLLVVSPAVPKDRSPFVAEAVSRGIPLTSEMNLFVQNCPARRVGGITGSAGKSTTTGMLGSILKAASESEPRPSGSGQCGAGVLPAGSATSGRAWVGGNIGCSLLDHLQSIQADDVVVLELSSFQLEDLARLEWSPHIAIITNLKPNHLDRHGTFEAYTEAKMNIVRYQRPGDRVFIPAGDDDLTERVARAGGADRLRHFSPEPALAAALRVPGRHNQGNAAAAAAAARAVGVAADAIQDGLKRFTGLPHRLEFVAERQGVRYFNDSKSTTPESSRIALQAFDAPVIMLVGGYDKKIPLDDLCRDLAVRAKAVVCYGQTAGQFAAGVRSYFGRTHATMIAPSAPASVVRAGTLEEAVQSAHQFADPGDVVVLSPACASYDQFSNYEERGETFRRLVQRTAEGM